MNRYHWFVFIVAVLGWMFDCLDQQLFLLARSPAMSELLQPGQNSDEYGAYATAIFILGWATGGLFFGMLGDRIGRARTMVLTILLYSLFTGLSALSVSFWDFAFYRFLTGLGVGGEFAVGVALVAEVMPGRARPRVLALLQALSAVGNISAAMIAMSVGSLVKAGVLPSVWRPLFLVGAIPALLALYIRRKLKEPERWQQASHEGAVARQLGSYRALFSHPTWRKHALIGVALAFSGVVGLWAVGFYSFDLVGNIAEVRFTNEVLDRRVQDGEMDSETAEAIKEKVRYIGIKSVATDNSLSESVRQHFQEKIKPEIDGNAAIWKSYTSLLFNLGAFVGMYSFGFITQRIGRRPAFAIAFLAAAASTVMVQMYLTHLSQIFWMIPIMGVCQLSLFAGYAIYFPELFPTYLRSTGTSFCYNVVRYISAVGTLVLGTLIAFYDGTRVERLSQAGLTMCVVFFVGLLVLPWAPETKDKPLPE